MDRTATEPKGKTKKKRAKSRHNVQLGKRGENAASAFLERKGFEIVERNYTCEAGEADIVAVDDWGLHFVEVKTRMSTAKGFPEEAVTRQKRVRYERIAELFLRDHDITDTPVTFDVVSILVIAEDRAFIKLFRNVLATDCVDR